MERAVVRLDGCYYRGGKVRGLVNQGVHSFKGVRYGADTAHRRFMQALAPTSWVNTLDATEYGAACVQSGKEEVATSEDCLFLNIWTPGMRDGAKRPVMFYIHGGAYSHGSGSSPMYDGTRLCRRGDVVVVTVNHRLNAFGYLYLARLNGAPPFADSGNAGMLDLVMALRWVRDNIAEFGGDPGRIMLFGQSGGGAKIATLMAMPMARGLFHRAATMSGQQLTASGPLNATMRAQAFLDALKLPVDRISELRTLPKERLIEPMSTTDPVIGKGSLYFGPVLDERWLQQHPFYPGAPTICAQVPMIIGNTHDETRLLIGRSDPAAFSLSWEQLPAKLAANMRVDIIPEVVVAAYREMYPHYSPSDVFFAATTAARSWRGAIIEVEARAAQGAPAFAYELDWKSPLEGGKWGAPHTLDIPLVFDNIDKKGALMGTSADAQKVADQMSATFIAFAKTGNPNTAEVPAWEPYQLPKRQTLVFDVKSGLVNDPRGESGNSLLRCLGYNKELSLGAPGPGSTGMFVAGARDACISGSGRREPIHVGFESAMDGALAAYMGATHASHGLTREGQPRAMSRRSLRNRIHGGPTGRDIPWRAPWPASPQKSKWDAGARAVSQIKKSTTARRASRSLAPAARASS